MKNGFKYGAGALAVLALVIGLATGAVNAHSKGGGMHSAGGVEIATLALGGYDPVAYFAEQRPVPGNGYYTANHKGVTYLFSSEQHQQTFKSNPEKYVPQFGGYCAYGVAVGKKFFSDPHRWKIVNGKLYLNLDEEIQKKWNQDIPGYIAKAESNWKSIEHKSPAEL